jgi:uncharacterized protein
MKKDQIRQVLIDQQSEFKTRQMLAMPRAQMAYLSDLVKQSKLAKIVQGIRRSGKSTICHQALLNLETVYVNFDDERLIGLDASELHYILELAKEIRPDARNYFFDEIQNIENWELFINRLQRTEHNLVLSGSNGKLLGKDLSTHLTGRQVSLILHPLSFSEFLSWKDAQERNSKISTLDEAPTTLQLSQLSRFFNEYFELGGFPEVVLGEPQGIYLRELFDKIIGRDIVQRYKIRDVRNLKEIASYLIQNSGQLVSLDKLKKAFGLASIVTTQKYVQLLEDVFLIHQLKGYSFKVKERTTLRRKTYACDLGMISALWTKPTQDIGARFETLIYLHLLRTGQEIFYIRQENREVDFCLLRAGKPHELVQACYDLTESKTREREVRALVDLGSKLKVRKLIIVTRDEEESINFPGGTIEVVPVVKYLLALKI